MESDDENSLDYWKTKFETLNDEFNEFQADSQELEAELEKELQETKKELAEWTRKYNQLKYDHDNMSERLESEVLRNKEKIEDLEATGLDMRKKDAFNVSCIRQLEQNVDDLEQTKRQALSTICTLENQLADELERNALLEADMDQQKELEAECHRLRVQAKDLSQDLLRHKKRESRLDSYNNSLSSNSKHASPEASAHASPSGMTKSSRLRNLSASSQPQTPTSQSSPAPGRQISTPQRESSTNRLEEMEVDETEETRPVGLAPGESLQKSETNCLRAKKGTEETGLKTNNSKTTSTGIGPDTLASLKEHQADPTIKTVNQATMPIKEPERSATGEDSETLLKSSATISSPRPLLNGQKPQIETESKNPASRLALTESPTAAGGMAACGDYTTPSRERAVLGQEAAIKASPAGEATEFQKLMQKSQAQNQSGLHSQNHQNPVKSHQNQGLKSKSGVSHLNLTKNQNESKTPESLQVGMHQNRQSAVNLVGDLLNKIGVLENKLSSCRRFIRESPWRDNNKRKSAKHNKNQNEKENLNTSNNGTPNRSRKKHINNTNTSSKSTVI